MMTERPTSSWSSGVLATPPRSRSWVRIPPGTFEWPIERRHDARMGIAAELKPRCVWVRIPLVPVEANSTWLVILPAACKAAVGKRGGGRRKVQFLHKPLEKLRNTPRSSNGQDAGPSSRRRRVQIPHEVLSVNVQVPKPNVQGRSNDQIPMSKIAASVGFGHRSLGLGHSPRRVCGCGHRVGLKNRRRWFDSNTLHFGISNLKSEISDLRHVPFV